MRVDHRLILAIYAPLAAATALLFSASGELHYVDGPSRHVLGFPFFWAVGGPNSLSLIVSLPALALNYLAYLLVLALLFSIFTRWSRPAKIAAPIIWLIAAAVVFAHWRIVTIDPTYVGWIEPEAGSSIAHYGFRFFGLAWQE